VPKAKSLFYEYEQMDRKRDSAEKERDSIHDGLIGETNGTLNNAFGDSAKKFNSDFKDIINAISANDGLKIDENLITKDSIIELWDLYLNNKLYEDSAVSYLFQLGGKIKQINELKDLEKYLEIQKKRLDSMNENFQLNFNYNEGVDEFKFNNASYINISTIDTLNILRNSIENIIRIDSPSTIIIEINEK